MQGNLIDRMAQLALQHPDMDVNVIYDMLMHSASDAEIQFLSVWQALLMAVAQEARHAPKDIQAIIQNS